MFISLQILPLSSCLFYCSPLSLLLSILFRHLFHIPRNVFIHKHRTAYLSLSFSLFSLSLSLSLSLCLSVFNQIFISRFIPSFVPSFSFDLPLSLSLSCLFHYLSMCSLSLSPLLVSFTISLCAPSLPNR